MIVSLLVLVPADGLYVKPVYVSTSFLIYDINDQYRDGDDDLQLLTFAKTTFFMQEQKPAFKRWPWILPAKILHS